MDGSRLVVEFCFIKYDMSGNNAFLRDRIIADETFIARGKSNKHTRSCFLLKLIGIIGFEDRVTNTTKDSNMINDGQFVKQTFIWRFHG